MKISTRGICKRYSQGDKVISALDHISIELIENCFTVVIGPSGCGKSTLLRTLAALEKPTEGTVFYDKQDIYSLSDHARAAIRRKSIGMVFQDYGLLPTMTALENICTPSLMDNHKPDMRYIHELCDILKISNRLHHIPSEMSGGEQQRVSVARALVNHPAVIFADEPTGNLDKQSARELMDLLLITKKTYNQTLMVVTHDMEIASRADIIIKMDNGKV